jgi:hypothetical protein
MREFPENVKNFEFSKKICFLGKYKYTCFVKNLINNIIWKVIGSKIWEKIDKNKSKKKNLMEKFKIYVIKMFFF